MKKIVSAILIVIVLIYLNYWIKHGESSNTVEYIIAIISIFILIAFIIGYFLKFISDKN